MKKIEIVLKRWPFPRKTKAITLYPFIFYRETPTIETRRHEAEHIKQVKKLGWFKFYGSYLVETVKKGYKKNKYEKAARKAEKEY